MDSSRPVFADDPAATPPAVPEDVRFDEEPPQHVPGSFLGAFPQFFIFPLILVATLTAVYMVLRLLAGSEAQSATELLSELRAAGPHARWQVLHGLADGLRRGTLDLSGVETAELAALYETYGGGEGDSPSQRALMRQSLLLVLAYKRDPSLTPYALEALDDPDTGVRRTALQALATMADPTCLPALTPWLSAPTSEERLLALGALANLDSPEALDLIADQATAEDSIVARNAVLVLARAGDPRATPFLGRMLVRDAYDGDAQLESDIAGLDAPSRDATRNAVVERFLIDSCRAAEALGDRGHLPALQKLREADPSLKVRSAAINALHALGASSESS